MDKQVSAFGSFGVSNFHLKKGRATQQAK